MNLFIIPSWYPSGSNASYGIFIKEQIEMMARMRSSWKIGVSVWGQGNPEKLLWLRDHFKNIGKIIRHNNDYGSSTELNGFKEFYQPALSWTKRLIKGNLKEIIKCNELNFQAHVMKYGLPDVISVQACYPGALVAKFLSEKYHIPYHIHIRLGGFMFEQMLSDARSLKSDVLSAIDDACLVTVTSSFQRTTLKKWVKDVQVLHNPVDVSFFKPNNDTPEDFSLCIARLEHEKGIDLLIDSFKHVSGLKLKIVGGGSEMKALEKQTVGNNQIELLGQKNRKEILELIQKARFLVLPSRFETFGNVILEAMACGKPIVATRCGGPEEIVAENTGMLCDISVENLAKKISEMQSRFTTFQVDKIRKHTLEEYAPEVWLNNFEKLLGDRW